MAELHYATISDIRGEAGFKYAQNLSDWTVGDQRRAAESEINAALSRTYTTPFILPIPEIIHTMTVKLAAAMLKWNAYHDAASKSELESIRKQLTGYANGDSSIPGVGGVDLSTGSGVDFDFGDAPRMFSVKQEF